MQIDLLFFQNVSLADILFTYRLRRQGFDARNPKSEKHQSRTSSGMHKSVRKSLSNGITKEIVSKSRCDVNKDQKSVKSAKKGAELKNSFGQV